MYTHTLHTLSSGDCEVGTRERGMGCDCRRAHFSWKGGDSAGIFDLFPAFAHHHACTLYASTTAATAM